MAACVRETGGEASRTGMALSMLIMEEYIRDSFLKATCTGMALTILMLEGCIEGEFADDKEQGNGTYFFL
jgi:hypothetical protein